jgi:hypothetical protein
MWLYGDFVARSIAALCAERELWKTMSPSRSGSAADASAVASNSSAEIAPQRTGKSFTAL